MQGISGPEQIITTESLIKRLRPQLRAGTRLFDRAPVKGKSGELAIYQIIWDNENLTRIDLPGVTGTDSVRHLHLSCGDRQFSIASDENRPFTLGRSPQNDLVVDAGLASRTHARIEILRGRFQLSDQSSAGTYIEMEDGETIYLRRQELLLWGSGTICLGEKPGANQHNSIVFSCPSFIEEIQR